VGRALEKIAALGTGGDGNRETLLHHPERTSPGAYANVERALDRRESPAADEAGNGRSASVALTPATPAAVQTYPDRRFGNHPANARGAARRPFPTLPA
jgi:hypothetical protein